MYNAIQVEKDCRLISSCDQQYQTVKKDLFHTKTDTPNTSISKEIQKLLDKENSNDIEIITTNTGNVRIQNNVLNEKF